MPILSLIEFLFNVKNVFVHNCCIPSNIYIAISVETTGGTLHHFKPHLTSNRAPF